MQRPWARIKHVLHDYVAPKLNNLKILGDCVEHGEKEYGGERVNGCKRPRNYNLLRAKVFSGV